ncbi:MAG: methylenetetrahydrofolate reductase [Pseudomonadota bacterium]
MASIINFGLHKARRDNTGAASLMEGFSIEVMPRTAAKIERFDTLLPAGTRVYIALLDGRPIDDMVGTARRLAAEGFEVMPHFPARIIANAAELRSWVTRYREEAGVQGALVLGGGVAKPKGAFHCAMQLLETGIFEEQGYARIHVTGHPEGNRDIDSDGGETLVMKALEEKQAWRDETGADMAIVTQFCFEAGPVADWTRRLAEAGITLPVHLGIAGPAKLQTLIKFAMACGVGPSLRVLQRRAADVTKLMTPFTPDGLLADLAERRALDATCPVSRIHLFPLGGISASATWARALSETSTSVAALRR